MGIDGEFKTPGPEIKRLEFAGPEAYSLTRQRQIAAYFTGVLSVKQSQSE
jgi:hypothetical protein